jgi:hypothetical protein
MKARILFLFGLLCAGAVFAVAHHSFDAEFDSKKAVTLQGTVTKFDFINPHGWIYLEGTDENGKSGSWAAETANVSSLLRRGWRKDSLKPGEEIVIEGQRAKDGSNTINARSVKLPDGRKLLAGSTPDGSAVK